MSQAQVKTVKRANKDQGTCGHCGVPLPPGSAYRYWKPGFHGRTKYRRCMKPECAPKRSELESSKLVDAYQAIEAAEEEIEKATTVEDVKDGISDCAGAIETLIGEYEDSIQENPMLEDQLREKIDQLQTFVDELQGFDPDDEPEEPEPFEEAEPVRKNFESDEDFIDAHAEWAEWKQESADALEVAKGEAESVLAQAEF